MNFPKTMIAESAQYVELAREELHRWLDNKLLAFFERTTSSSKKRSLEQTPTPTTIKIDHVQHVEEGALKRAKKEVGDGKQKTPPGAKETASYDRIKKNKVLIKRYTELLAGVGAKTKPHTPRPGAREGEEKMLAWTDDYVLQLGMEAKRRGLIGKKKAT